MPITVHFGGGASGLPAFTYTGTYTLLDDGGGNWRIKFLTSGTATFEKTVTIDVFCVGGGGGSAPSTSYATGGGGSGYTNTYSSIVCVAGVSYSVVVGAGGAASLYGTVTGGKSWFSIETQYYANGGLSASYYSGGYGGSGGGGANNGDGGSDGSDGAAGTHSGGTGQGTTTREFGEETGTLYAGGGGGGPSGADGSPGQADNTGSGAKGFAQSASGSRTGSSGIVVIRNHRAA